jgi:hypothetical protein
MGGAAPALEEALVTPSCLRAALAALLAAALGAASAVQAHEKQAKAPSAQASRWPGLQEYRSNYLPPIQQARSAAERATSGLRQLGVEENSNAYRRLASDDPDAFNRRSSELQRRREKLTRDRDQADARLQAACDRYQERQRSLAGQGVRTAAQNATLRGVESDLRRYCSRRASR